MNTNQKTRYVNCMDIAWQQDKELQFEEPHDKASREAMGCKTRSKSLQTNPIPLFLVFSYILSFHVRNCLRENSRTTKRRPSSEGERRCQGVKRALTDLANFLWRDVMPRGRTGRPVDGSVMTFFVRCAPANVVLWSRSQIPLVVEGAVANSTKNCRAKHHARHTKFHSRIKPIHGHHD